MCSVSQGMLPQSTVSWLSIVHERLLDTSCWTVQCCLLQAHQLAGTSTPSTMEPMSLPPSGLATPVSEQHAPVPGVLEQAVAHVTPSLGRPATAADGQGSSHALPMGLGQAAETAAQQGEPSSEHQQPQAADAQGPGAAKPAGAADGDGATAAAEAPTAQQEPPPPPLAKGEMASAFREFFRQVSCICRQLSHRQLFEARHASTVPAV